MNLLLIILFLVIVSFIPKIFPKCTKLFVVLSILIVISFYFLLSKNFFHVEAFYPTDKIRVYTYLGNYYNFIVNSIKKKQTLYLHINYKDFPLLKQTDIYQNYGKYVRQNVNYVHLFDTSLYKGKLYLYFGITPLILFYIPFNLITGLYLTDKLLVLILVCFSFILSLFLLFKMNQKFITDKNISILNIFIMGFCSYYPFILIRSSTYEVAIITANVLLLCAFIMLYFYLNNKFNYSVFCIGLLLGFSVGARPHYILFIPLFFVIIYLKNYYYGGTKDVIKQAIIFLVPCIIIGSIIALYNYLRFDSIFEFGFRYALNEENHYGQFTTIKDSFIALKYNLFQFPDISEQTIFSLVKTEGHLFGNEFIAGIFWTFPLMFLFVFLLQYLKETFNKNKPLFYVVILMCSVICINIFVTSFIGMVNRYFVEYMPFIIILLLLLFNYVNSKINTKFLKKVMKIFFVLIFIYSVFINVSLLFCENNSIFYADSSKGNYDKTVQFLYGSF